MTARICSSDWTSQASTKSDPMDVASGRTRLSMRLSTDEKQGRAAPWSASAIPQAIEWSFRDAEDERLLASSRPSLALPGRRRCPKPGRRPRLPSGHAETGPPPRHVSVAAVRSRRRADGCPGPGPRRRRRPPLRPEAASGRRRGARCPRGSRIPYRGRHQLLARNRQSLADAVSKQFGRPVDPRRLITAASAAAGTRPAITPGSACSCSPRRRGQEWAARTWSRPRNG